MQQSIQARFIAYFADRHILANMIVVGVLLGGFLCWKLIGKEEMPDFVNDRVSVSVNYPGATAEEVEHFVVRPLENALRGVDGVVEVDSRASQGTGRVSAHLDFNNPDFQETVAEIRSVTHGVSFPAEIREEPRVRQFRSSAMAIIDVALYDTSAHLLDEQDRRELQALALNLENRLLGLPEVSAVNRSGFLRDELQIRADPGKLRQYNIPLSALASEVGNHNQRRPAGSLKDREESKVTVAAQLDSVSVLEDIIVQGGFEGPVVRLGDVAAAGYGFEEIRSIQKVNGYEALLLNVVKTPNSDILSAVAAVQRELERFRAGSLRDVSVRLVTLDDESRGVRGRLSLIASNGTLGILLILFLLFVLLSARAALWVALSIPFCFGVTLIGAYWMGYTVNNMTLAAVIIVMGMVVDDAIVVAENITRLRGRGMDPRSAAVEGARFVSMPITAAILTTCAAFVPLFFFDDRFGQLVKVLPVVISLMLLASLLESLLILPGHMRLPLSFRRRGTDPASVDGNARAHWFEAVERVYGNVLRGTLRFPWLVLLVFAVLLAWAVHIFREDMRFVLFPNEETTQVRVDLEAPPDVDRFGMAELSLQVENSLSDYMGREMIGHRTSIARSRWGRAVEENVASMRVEIVPRDQREKPVQELIAEWRARTDTLPGLVRVDYRASRFGHESGNSLEIQVLENSDVLRRALADSLAARLRAHPHVVNVEIDRPPVNPEYRIGLRRDVLRRLSIDPGGVGNTLRTLLEGSVLYDLAGDAEEIPVVLTIADEFKTDLDQLLDMPVENRGGYLVRLADVVTVERGETPSEIERERYRRLTTVYADVAPASGLTPLEVADELERDLFPVLAAGAPTSIFRFDGEVEDSRRSQGNFGVSILVVLLLIFALLALLFNSLLKPFLIMFSIPFGVVGVILAFHFHGMHQYGFFAMVGMLGLMGVVINDSIVMLVRLGEDVKVRDSLAQIRREVADASGTRLRAVLLTTFTTVAGLFPTAYGVLGFDGMLAEMMLAMGWGLLFGSLITLLLVPTLYAAGLGVRLRVARLLGRSHA